MNFDRILTGQPVSGIGYHWGDVEFGKLTFGTLRHEPIYVCDEPFSWSSPWLKTPPTLYRVSYTVNNPIVFHQHPVPYEANLGSDRQMEDHKQQGYDGLVYTPGTDCPEGTGIRQARLFDAKSQITELVEITQSTDYLKNWKEPMENKIDPEDDGVSHCNVWTKGKTLLGRQLSNLANIPMLHPEYGRFACLEGFWFWLATGKEHNVLRGLSGFEARKTGKDLARVDNPDFQKEFKEGMYWRLAQNPDLSDLLRRVVGYDQLELKHYYVYGNEPGNQKVVDVTERHQWQMDFYKWWAELPENDLLGKPVQFWGKFVEYDSALLKKVVASQLGAWVDPTPWAKDVIVGCQLTQADSAYVYDNYKVWHESHMDNVLTADPIEYTFKDLVDIYQEGLPKTRKYVVLKGEFKTDTADIINCLQVLGYTVLSRPLSGDEPVVVGDNSDPELTEALVSVNVLVLTEQHILNQEPA